jgi:hypothetical protein
MRISVHIERLILEGLPVTSPQGHQVQAAVESELVRLLATADLLRELHAGGAVPEVRVPT